MFEKVNRSLKYDSNFFFVHKHIYIYQDTTTDHFTPLALRVRGNDSVLLSIFGESTSQVSDDEALCIHGHTSVPLDSGSSPNMLVADRDP